MAFPEKLLNEDEQIVLDIRPHWVFFARRLAQFVAALVLFVASLLIGFPGQDIISLILLAAVVVALVALVARLVVWQGINMVVTSERMVYRSGVLAKKGIEIPLDRINTVFFNQTVRERVLGTGDLTVESAGEGGQQHFADVWRPNRVQQMIYQAKEANEDQDFKDAAEAIVEAQAEAASAAAPAIAAPTMAPAAASIPEQIAQLDELRVRGVITDAEFQAKKTELLDRM